MNSFVDPFSLYPNKDVKKIIGKANLLISSQQEMNRSERKDLQEEIFLFR